MVQTVLFSEILSQVAKKIIQEIDFTEYYTSSVLKAAGILC